MKIDKCWKGLLGVVTLNDYSLMPAETDADRYVLRYATSLIVINT